MAKPWNIVDLIPDEPFKICLNKILFTRFQETFSYEPGTLKGEDIEALHDMRVAARRTRAILRIYKECFPRKKFKKHDERLTNLIRSLGGVRECDIFIALLDGKRKTLSPRDGKIIDLLLAREMNNRFALRKRLSSELGRLRRSRYADSFNQFLRDTLEKRYG